MCPVDSEITLSHNQISLRVALLDVIFGVLLTLLALALWIGADYIEGGSSGMMGPAGFPRGVALILGVTTLLTVDSAHADRDGERIYVCVARG